MKNTNVAPERLPYLDHLRSLVIALVVVMHSNVTYSGMGGWFYKEGSPDQLDVLSRVLFGFYGSFTQAWFLGALFFVSAYLSVLSLRRKGTARFVRDRLVRLGLPLLFYVAVVHPLTVYWFAGGAVKGDLLAFLGYWFGEFRFVGGTGPLWFVEVLLVFDLLYAGVRGLIRPREGEASAPRFGAVFLLVTVTAAGAYGLRLFWPIGTDVANLQFGFFASYIVLFLVGLHAGERGWFVRLAEDGRRWLTLAIAAGVPSWVVLMVAGGALSGMPPIWGGFYWQSAAYAVWESFVAVTMTLGLVGVFQKNLGAENRLTRYINARSFGIYVLHAPVLVGISLLAAGLELPMLLKHVIIAPLAWLCSLAVSDLASRVPVLRKILR